MIYFTADTHFGHANVIKFCNRPFSSTEEMNEVLIQNWNSEVSDSDTIYFLGDFCFSKKQEDIRNIFNKLNGNKILIKGNHDHKNVYKKLEWGHVCEQMSVVYENDHIWLNHYPLSSWNRSCHGSWHVHGHIHSQGKYFHNGVSCDVGVDNWNYKPVSFNTLKQWFTILDQFRKQEPFIWKGKPFEYYDIVYFSEIEQIAEDKKENYETN